MQDGASGRERAGGVTRRVFLKGAGLEAAALAATGLAGESARAAEAARREEAARTLEGEVELVLSINGEERRVRAEPRTTLLSVLRDRIDPALTGTKLVCDRGQCGACTVLVDGEPVYSCLVLAADALGRAVTTIEGLGSPEELSALQQAFCEHDASMCGFCTPGFVVALSAFLEREPEADLEAIRAACSGNVCRCGTYPQVFEAALAAGRELAARKGGGGR
jgi:xanthine dehydrogenase YagT iron-sulfur-binding subunit